MAHSSPTFILTGASRGLGLACLKTLLDAPFAANVVAISRSTPPALDGLAAKYPGNLVISQGDVASDAVNAEAVAVALRAFGRLDGLVLNAGIMDLSKVADASLDVWRHMFDVNFLSLVSILKHAIPELRKSRGNVVFVSSGAATGGTASWGAYNTTKAAMNSLCRTVANEEKDITFVALRPGVVDTDMQALVREHGGKSMTEGDLSRFTSLHASGQLVPAEKPGHVMAALALTAEKKLSGGFFSWDSDDMKPYTKLN